MYGDSDNPKVSIIIPVYNAEHFIVENINSILSQTLQEIEVICINDGSTDQSLEILSTLSEKEKRLVVISQCNAGAGIARNKGIVSAKGEYLMFIDPDDRFSSFDAIEKIYKAAEKHKGCLCCGTMNYLVGKKVIAAKEYHCVDDIYITEQEAPFCFGHTRFIYPRKEIIDKKLFYPSYRRYQDPPFLARAIVYFGGYWGYSFPIIDYRKAYKAEKYTYEKLFDYLSGVKQVLTITDENEMNSAFYHATQDLSIWPIEEAVIKEYDNEIAHLFVEIDTLLRKRGKKLSSFLISTNRLKGNQTMFDSVKLSSKKAMYKTKQCILRHVFNTLK